MGCNFKAGYIILITNRKTLAMVLWLFKLISYKPFY